MRCTAGSMSHPDLARFSKLEEAFFAAGERLAETPSPYRELDRSDRPTGWWKRLVGWYVPARWTAPNQDAFEPVVVVALDPSDVNYVSYEVVVDNDDYEMALRYDQAA